MFGNIYKCRTKKLGNTHTDFTQRRMKENTDSDFNPAMVASHAFETIIDKIRHSNLNFQLQMFPFSAQISLKKSLVIDKSGVHCLPPDIHAVSEASTFKSDT